MAKSISFDADFKKCSICNITKSISEFNTRKDRLSGIRSQCKACDKNTAREWYLIPENKEKSSTRTLKWKKENPEKNTVIAINYQKRHPEKVTVNNQNHEAKKRENGGRIDAGEWDRLKEKYNFTCLKCRKTEPDIKLTLDHVKPIKNGGLNIIDNIQPLCRSCNCSKGAKEVDYR